MSAAPRQDGSGRSGRAARRLAGPALVLLGGALGAAYTWRTWPDPIVDFGRDLYLAWRVLEGEALYRDLGHFNGPLSVYLNAAWMGLAGVGMLQVVLLNALVWVGIALLLHAWAVRVSDRATAAVVGLVFATISSFLQLVPVANYNFLTPYAHEMTHGLALSLAALAALARARERGGLRWVGFAGAAFGAIFLTKAEVFLAAAAGVGLGLSLLLRDRARTGGRRSAGRVALLFAASAASPIALAWAALAARTSSGADAARAVVGAFAYVSEREVHALDFYRRITGLADPIANLAAMRDGFVLVLAAVAGAVALAHLLVRGPVPTRLAAVLALVGGGAGAWLGIGPDRLLFAGRPLPIVAAAIAVGLAVAWVRIGPAHPGRAQIERAQIERALAFAVFALALLAKMLVNSRTFHYGFALAAPAAALTVTALLGWLPHVAAPTPQMRLTVRAALLGVIVAVSAAHLEVGARRQATRTEPIGAGPDRFFADRPSARLIAGIERVVREELAPDATLAVLPQGAMVSYLLRRRNPTGFVQVLPPEVIMFGEENLIAAFEARPPDAIVWIEMDLSSLGAGQIGEGFATDFRAWIETHYRRERPILGDPRRPAWLMLPATRS